jgi:hypothetical protein
MIVVEKPTGELVITTRHKHYQQQRRKPERALTMYVPQRLLPPPPKPLTLTITRTTNVKNPPPEWFKTPEGVFGLLAAALLLRGK